METHTHGRQPVGGAGTPARPTAWWSRRAVGLHVTLIVVVPLFAGLFWWQVQRVRQGNTLSWAYVFEWPFFAGYAVYLWWRLVHDQPQPARPGGRGGPAGPGSAQETVGTADAGPKKPAASPEDDDEELAAYNRYLARLNADNRQKRW